MQKQPNKDEILKMFSKKQSKQSNSTKHDNPKITNIHELRQLVERLKPGGNDSNQPPIVIPQSGGESTLRKTLLEGFEMIKNHSAYYQASVASLDMDDKYGGYPPAIAPNPDTYDTWVDRFIRNNLGGRRVGLTIVWDLPSGTWQLDPWTCKLEQVNAT
jgi:hypothetical protein